MQPKLSFKSNDRISCKEDTSISRLDENDTFSKNRPYLRHRYRKFNNRQISSFSENSSVINPNISHVLSNENLLNGTLHERGEEEENEATLKGE